MTRLRWPIAVLLWLLPALALSQSTTPGGSGSGGGATGSVTSAGTNGTQAQGVQGINGGVPVATTAASPDAVVSTFSITATGPTAGLPLKDYGSALAELLSGSFSATIQVSTNSTDGVNGDWSTAIGDARETTGTTPGSTISAAVPKRLLNGAAGAWVRLNVTAVTTAGTAAITRRTAPYQSSNVTMAAGANVIGSTTLRSAGTNRSATVGTTAAALWPVETTRQGGWIKNDTATALWCNFDGTASAVAGGGNFQIAANGGVYTTEPGFVSTNALSCISTASIAVTSRTH